MVDRVRCRRCDFKGIQDEVDDHFVARIRTVDYDHTYMTPTIPELPAGFAGRVSPLGECWHDRREKIRLDDPDLGWASYCRDCHIVVDSPVQAKCICGGDPHRIRDDEGNSLHRTDCPYYVESLANSPEWIEHQARLRYRREHPAEARARDRAEQEHQWREGVIIQNRGGETTVWVKGEIYDEARITQVWGECNCEAATATQLHRFPGPSHHTTCPRYRRRPFG
jgi:hypothetical protein